jgi:hypothetical protein
MQNTKIQTLWSLCTELKEKRQFLVERLKHTQDYLDEQQWNLSREMHGLRQQTNSLAHDVHDLSQAVDTVYSLWSQTSTPTAEAFELPDFQALIEAAQTHQTLYQRFAQEAETLARLQGEVQQPGSPEIFQEGMQELQAEFNEQYQALKDQSLYFADLQNHALSNPDQAVDFSEFIASLSTLGSFLDSFSADTTGFQTQWQASVPYRETAPAAPDNNSDLAQQLETREALLAETYTQAYASAVALAELQSNHDDLAGEMDHLMTVLSGFQEILNQRPQAAAATSSDNADDEDAETEDSADSPESDRQAVREAVQESSRKRIAQVLKKRFTKVPRRVSNLLKKVEVGTRLDKLFELALECESMDVFSAQLEETAG